MCTLKLSKGTTCTRVPYIELLWMDSHLGSGYHIIVYCYDRWASAVLWFLIFLAIQGPGSTRGLTLHFSCSIRFYFSCLPLTVSLNKMLWRGKKIERVEKRGRIDAPSERCRAEQGPGCIVSPAPRRSIAQLEVRRRLKSLVEWSTAKTPEEKQECWEERQLTGRLIDRWSKFRFWKGSSTWCWV